MAEKPLTAVTKPAMPVGWNSGSRIASKNTVGLVKTSQKAFYGLVNLSGSLPGHRMSGAINLTSQILSILNRRHLIFAATDKQGW